MIPVDPPESQRQSEISPDNIFVRYYVERARQLRREKRITPALWGWFCVLAERIGESGAAWASMRVIADDMGSSMRCAQQAMRKLEALDLVRCSFRNGRSTQYRFAPIFAYGNGGDREITPDHKITPDHLIRGGDDQKIRGGDDQKIRGGVIIGSPIRITNEDKESEEEENRSKGLAPKPQEKEKGIGQVYGNPKDELRFQLQRRGIKLETAVVLMQQFDLSEIEGALAALSKAEVQGKTIKNPGGYIIATVEKQTGRAFNPAKQLMEMTLTRTRLNR